MAPLRNFYCDAHGVSENGSKPTERHADLAVNLAGTISVFLLPTYQEKFKTE
jgi:hypothetical protein